MHIFAPRLTFSPTSKSPGSFFSPALDDQGEPTGDRVCKTCGKCRKHTPRTGYTNLVSHARESHPTYEDEMHDASALATGTLAPWANQKATNRFAWMLWIVMCNLPFSFCESGETRR
ncbi:hypothetical protein PI124_g22724 [Phytophthora idaei]|nr:hypothetical protein PI125_g3929 [Phytophthora idaei]KAG3125749.1 hypothetical protein PI126_g22628 [Phytophthora idaei]KAG3232189.1 hypothetical protein PI124_g22724 [Phytophthora idaei]